MGKYLKDDGVEDQCFTKTVMDEFPDEPAYRKCRSTLNSSAKLESLVLQPIEFFLILTRIKCLFDLI